MYGDGSVTDKTSISICNVALVTDLQVASFAELDTTTLYAILRLRCDVFIVEQACAYPDVDGRDVEPGTRHVWLTPSQPDDEGPAVLGYLRILEERGNTARIGRVCIARDARRAGLGKILMSAALAVIGERAAVLDAQAYATRLYEEAGFVPDGPEFVEDGIPHVPMRRDARSPSDPLP
jgi:ElaA protein